MRDEKEERKKQARSVKQTRQSNTAHPRQSLRMRARHDISGAGARATRRALGTYVRTYSLVPRLSPSSASAPCALRVIIKCGGGKTEGEGLEEFIT